MTTEVKEKKKRAPRRNYERELADLRMYIQIKIGVLNDQVKAGGDAVYANQVSGQIAALVDISSRLKGAK